MKFRYQARTKEGEEQVGFVDASDRDTAVSILTTHGLFILSLEEAERVRWYDFFLNYFYGVGRRDLSVFARQLANLMEARLPLSNTLDVLFQQTSNPKLKEAVFQISEDVESGLSFSQALGRQSAIFPNFYVSVIRSAEVVGNLENATAFLADYLEKEEILINKARTAMIYPGIILALFAAVSFIIVTFVIPQIEPVFSQANVDLPIFTKFLIFWGDLLNQWWWLILIVLVVTLVILFDYLQTPEGKGFKDELKIRLPLVRKVYLPMTISRVANVVAVLLKGGVPMVQSLEIAGETTDNVIYSDIIHQLAENVRQGEALSQSMSKFPDYFPMIVSQMLGVGEKTGHVDQAFTKLADIYGREADNVVNNVVELIQPIMIIGIGALVGVLFASILLPLYELAGKI